MEDPYQPPPNPTTPPPLNQNSSLGDNAGIRMLMPVGRSGWAIAAGYLGLFALLILPAPLALVFSIIALRDLKKSKASNKPKYGMGRAIFGLIMGILGTLVLLIFLLPSFFN